MVPVQVLYRELVVPFLLTPVITETSGGFQRPKTTASRKGNIMDQTSTSFAELTLLSSNSSLRVSLDQQFKNK